MNLKQCFSEIRPTVSVEGFETATEPCLAAILAGYFYADNAIAVDESVRFVEAYIFAEAYIEAWIKIAEVALFTNVGVNDES